MKERRDAAYMKGKILGAVCYFLLALLLPYVVTLAWTGSVEGEAVRHEVTENQKIWLDRGGVPKVMGLEEYLPGAVAAQMPAEYGLEALRAQAILARTYILKNMGNETEIAESALDLDWWDAGQMKTAWGDQFQEYYDLLNQAVETTRGMTAQFDGTYIDGLFCRASAGSTRNGDSRHPYLKAAASSQDVEMEGYLTVITWTKEEFAARLNEANPSASVSAAQLMETLQIAARDESGYVTQLQAGSGSFTGEEAAAALGLPSACFLLEEYEGNLRGICKGQGHGYGLSQYGAKVMAERGLPAEEILSYYFQNVTIQDGSSS